MRERRVRLRRWIGMPVAITALVALLTVVTVTILGPGRRGDSGRRTGVVSSIAVLPLKNLSGDAEQEYFADGMTESLITDLAQISALKVISPTSVMQYKNPAMPASKIARDLGVEAVLEGSVQKVGQRITINLRLLDARTKRHLWAKDYERDYRDILSLRREIARTVAAQIRVVLTPHERQVLSGGELVNADAYDACLLGDKYFNEYTSAGFERAREQYEKAIEKDPDFALAHARLGGYYGSQAYWGYRSFEQVQPMIERSLVEIERLDASRRVLVSFRANYYYHLKWDWEAASQAFEQALALSPNDADLHVNYALLLSTIGKVG